MSFQQIERNIKEILTGDIKNDLTNHIYLILSNAKNEIKKISESSCENICKSIEPYKNLGKRIDLSVPKINSAKKNINFSMIISIVTLVLMIFITFYDMYSIKNESFNMIFEDFYKEKYDKEIAEPLKAAESASIKYFKKQKNSADEYYNDKKDAGDKYLKDKTMEGNKIVEQAKKDIMEKVEKSRDKGKSMQSVIDNNAKTP